MTLTQLEQNKIWNNASPNGLTEVGMAAPALSPAGSGRIYFDSGTNVFRMSSNGAAYVDIASAASGGGWTDDGVVVRLTTSTDNVTIGSAVAGGKLFIDGDANEIQLQVQGVAGQSANLQEWQDSAGVAQNAISLGSSTVSGTENTNLGVGAGIAYTTGSRNTCVGNNAGNLLNTGSDNTAVGWHTIDTATSGSRNTSIGSGAGGPVPSPGVQSDNVFVGYNAGTLNTGSTNTFIGSSAGASSTSAVLQCMVGYNAGTLVTGTNNTIFGAQAGDSFTTGIGNTLIGANAGGSISATAMSDCVFVGNSAGSLNTANQNTFVGGNCGQANTSGFGHTAVGYNSLASMTTNLNCTAVGIACLTLATGSSNTAVGSNAGDGITTGTQNCLMGTDAGGAGASGAMSDCTFLGTSAGINNTANQNTFVGSACGVLNTSGTHECFVGYNAGHFVTGSSNSLFGWFAGSSFTTGTNNCCFGSQSGAAGAATTMSDCAFFGKDTGLVCTGNQNTLIGSLSGNTLTSGTNNCLLGYNTQVVTATDSGCVIIGASKTSNATGDLLIESTDVGIARLAAGVLQPTNGARAAAWMQDVGRIRRSATQTVTDSAALTADNTLSIAVLAGRKYIFRIEYFFTTVATSGVQVDCGGGTATFTNFHAWGDLEDGTTGFSARSDMTTSTTTLALTVTGTVTHAVITGCFTCNAAGTFVPRFAQNAETAAAESVIAGVNSNMLLWDTP